MLYLLVYGQPANGAACAQLTQKLYLQSYDVLILKTHPQNLFYKNNILAMKMKFKNI